MLSACFSQGFPEKGMAWCVMTAARRHSLRLHWCSEQAGQAAGLRRGCGTGMATKTIESNEKLELSLSHILSSGWIWPLPAPKCYSPPSPLASSLLPPILSPGSPTGEACVAPQRPIPWVLPVAEEVDLSLEGLVLHPSSPFRNIWRHIWA